MADPGWAQVLDTGTALVWFLLALAGIVLRVRRLRRLDRIILPQPEHPEDVDYLRSVKRSTHLRLATKLVLLLGAAIALFGLVEFYLLWRLGIIVVLVLMISETTGVDAVRARLARHATMREAQSS